jgi:hypothetical protein
VFAGNFFMTTRNVDYASAEARQSSNEAMKGFVFKIIARHDRAV